MASRIEGRGCYNLDVTWKIVSFTTCVELSFVHDHTRLMSLTVPPVIEIHIVRHQARVACA